MPVRMSTGMVLAAGKGVRMRPITATRPKPMIKLAGRTLVDRSIDRLEDAGVETVVVNTCYLAAILENHLAKRARPRIVISHEDRLLDTGGGVARALDHFAGAPFPVVNSDSIWTNGPLPALDRLCAAWNDTTMDALLLLFPMARVQDDLGGRGDYFLAPGSLARRRRPAEVAPYLFTGVQMLHPRLFEGAPEGPFSMNLLYDRAQAAGRLKGLVHDGEWLHVGTPGQLDYADRLLRDRPLAAEYR